MTLAEIKIMQQSLREISASAASHARILDAMADAVYAMELAAPAAPAPVPPLQGAEAVKVTPLEPDGRMWSIGRAEFIRHAQSYEDARSADKASIIADCAGSEIYRAMWRTAPLHAVGGQSPTVEQAINALVSALADSKGWMRDYADAIVRDAIDRRGEQEKSTEGAMDGLRRALAALPRRQIESAPGIWTSWVPQSEMLDVLDEFRAPSSQAAKGDGS